jgi:hypothetical protein
MCTPHSLEGGGDLIRACSSARPKIGALFNRQAFVAGWSPINDDAALRGYYAAVEKSPVSGGRCGDAVPFPEPTRYVA